MEPSKLCNATAPNAGPTHSVLGLCEAANVILMKETYVMLDPETSEDSLLSAIVLHALMLGLLLLRLLIKGRVVLCEWLRIQRIHQPLGRKLSTETVVCLT